MQYQSTKELGRRGEELVCEWYIKSDFALIGKNVRVHGYRQIGEIDLIFTKDKELVFVEVKTRRSSRFGDGRDSVGFRKQMKLRKSVAWYLSNNSQYDLFNWRIDVAEVNIDNSGNKIIILENAMEDY
ncbi:MAG: YraN family protein [Candidatus Doudnabacteria bacterium]|nr:YraN family protein [Candidatus Doudnabacteria bacterium]